MTNKSHSHVSPTPFGRNGRRDIDDVRELVSNLAPGFGVSRPGHDRRIGGDISGMDATPWLAHDLLPCPWRAITDSMYSMISRLRASGCSNTILCPQLGIATSQVFGLSFARFKPFSGTATRSCRQVKTSIGAAPPQSNHSSASHCWL